MCRSGRVGNIETRWSSFLSNFGGIKAGWTL
jgi:hypothetical protein